MARAEVVTWLSLDRWATIMGISPLSFNQLNSPTLYRNTTCGDVFFQNSWMHSDRVGRDDVARAIQEAEQEIAQEVGYGLLPDWTYAERLPYPRPGQPGVFNIWGTNPQGYFKSIEALRGHIISGGIKAKSLVQAGVTFVRTDADVDGYAETCTALVPTTLTDAGEIHLYYPAQNGDDAWEIRPIKVNISGGIATIIFKSWQVAAANQMDALDAQPLDADIPGSYETTVDVYRVYNDPSVQVQFLWENGGICGQCVACQFGTQNGCFHLRDTRVGVLVPSPGTWDSSSQSFTMAEWSACREPDQVKLYYYSGNIDWKLQRPYTDVGSYWETAIAYFAASKLDRAVCGCSNVSEQIEKWRKDQMFSSLADGGLQVTPEFAANRLGTSAGAFYAYRRIHQNGIHVNK